MPPAEPTDGGPQGLEGVLGAALAAADADRANLQLREGSGLVLCGSVGFERAFLDFFAIVRDADCA